jgi:hypothetical protein
MSDTSALQRADHRFGKTFVEFQKGRAGRLDPECCRFGAGSARVFEQDGVFEARLAGADEWTTGKHPRHRMVAFGFQFPHGVNGRSIEVAGVADRGHTMTEIGQRRIRREFQCVVWRQMDMHVDEAG